MNYIKRFQNAKAFSVSVGYSYSEDKLMHIFLDNFHRGGKYTAQIASHQVEVTIEETFTDQKSLYTTYLQTDYLNLDRSSVLVEIMREQILFRQNAILGGGYNHSSEKWFKMIRKDKEKSRADGDSYKQRTERTPRKFSRCGYVDRLIAKCPKRPKDNYKQQNQFHFNERCNCASQKTSENSDNNSDQNIYASMARISINEKSPSRYFGDS